MQSKAKRQEEGRGKQKARGNRGSQHLSVVSGRGRSDNGLVFEQVHEDLLLALLVLVPLLEESAQAK